jgi:Fe2+ transport system protein FeoA
MKTLSEIEGGKRVIVADIIGGKKARERLSSHGISVGIIIDVKRNPSEGPLLLEVHGNEEELGRGVASKVQVEEL